MSDDLGVAIIAGAAGFFGALAGAAGAVFGPWWLQRDERTSQSAAGALEARRRAIVQWTDAQVELANAFEGVSLAEVASSDRADEIREASTSANKAQTELLSRLDASDVEVRRFIRGSVSVLGVYVDSFDRRTAAAHAGEVLLAWHSGVSSEVPMYPYAVGRPEDRADPAAWRLLEFEEWSDARILASGGMPRRLWKLPDQ